MQQDSGTSHKRTIGWKVLRAASVRQRLGLYGGILLAVATLLFLDLEPEVGPEAAPQPPVRTRTAAMLILMATWWITEAVPLAITALLPLLLLPLFGVLSADAVAGYYFKSITALFVGGFLLALAIERWGLHRRIALHTLSFFGFDPARMVLGFLLTSGFLSMWISNSAAAMIMVPIALSVIQQLQRQSLSPDPSGKAGRNISAGILLAVAYGANVGGFATLVGTPPNMVLAGIFRDTFPEATPPSFGSWMIFALPLSLVFQVSIWFLLVRVILPVPKGTRPTGGSESIREELRSLGPMSPEERLVAGVFVLTTFLWVFRVPINLGFSSVPGWSLLLPAAARAFVDDGTVAIGAGLLLFMLPAPSLRAGIANDSEKRLTDTALLDWNTAKRLPWGIILLFGGGFALAGAMKFSGLSATLGESLRPLAAYPAPLLVFSISLLVTFLTEVTSNTATTTVVLPILADLAAQTGHPPLLLMVPAALSASCAFMLPVATPPNAIVYASERVPLGTMLRAGLVLNFLGAILITIGVFTLGVTKLG